MWVHLNQIKRVPSKIRSFCNTAAANTLCRGSKSPLQDWFPHSNLASYLSSPCMDGYFHKAADIIDAADTEVVCGAASDAT